MKRIGVASAALFLLSLVMPQVVTAQSSVRGTYRFLLEDEVTRFVELDARSDERGLATGHMIFIDQSKVPDVDDVEDPRSDDAPPELYIRAELDALTIEKNRAVMSGTIMDSSHRSYIGKWVQLVVEDNGDNLRVPDRLTWEFCRPSAARWIPTDADRKDDDGAYLRWWATDADRDDDVGVPSIDLLADERGCRIHPLSLYSFAEVLKKEGDLIVQP
jgi:hypothetical protein